MLEGPPELVIFDCDGVLVDSEMLSVEIDRRVLAEFGWHLTEEQIVHRFVGRSSAHFRAELESYLGRSLPDDWEDPYRSWHDKLRRTLGTTGLYSRFEGRIFSATEVVSGKPAPDLFLHAASCLGASPDRCVVIEDSRFGVMAARAAGMTAFGYAGGVTPAEWLHGANTTVFDDMTELPGLLGVPPL